MENKVNHKARRRGYRPNLNPVENSLIQSEIAYHNWNFNGGKQKAKLKCLEMINSIIQPKSKI